MKWRWQLADEKRGKHDMFAKCGHLFVRIMYMSPYQEPGHPDYCPEWWEWFIEPDEEDKAYRRALATGRGDTKAEAFGAVVEQLQKIAGAMLEDLQHHENEDAP